MTVVTKENCILGASVVRGPRWCYGDQDRRNDGNGIGVIVRYEHNDSFHDDWVYVEWDGGYGNVYCLTEAHLCFVEEQDLAAARASAEERKRREDERYAREPI